jgi:hypothetical protein
VKDFEPKIMKGAAASIDQWKNQSLLHVEFPPATWAKQRAEVDGFFEYLTRTPELAAMSWRKMLEQM